MDAEKAPVNISHAPLFSLIMPAYNVEKYIDRCLRSICSQKGSFEIIVVDDGATDKTGEIADSWAKQDSRIHVYHTKNRGAGAARNLGLDNATGEYIWFIDPDDWIEPGSLSKLASLIDTQDPQIIFCNLCYIYEQGNAQLNVFSGDFADQLIVPSELSDDDFFAMFAWRAHPVQIIAKREYLHANACNFFEVSLGEDHLFALKTLLNARSVYVTSAPLYNYFRRQGSSTLSSHKDSYEFVSICRECLNYLRENKFLQRFPWMHKLYVLPLPFYIAHTPANTRRKFLAGLRENLKHFPVANLNLSFSEKLFYFAIKLRSPWVASLAVNVLAASGKMWVRAVRKPRTFLKKGVKKALGVVKRQIFQLNKSKDREGWITGPGQDGCLNGIIEPRVTQKNAPYVIAAEGAVLRGHVVFERGIGALRLGERASVGGGTTIIISQPKGIEIGPQVMVSWGCTLMDGNMHSLDWEERIDDEWHWHLSERQGVRGFGKYWANVESRPIRIGANAWIGCNSIVLGGVTIGRGAIVGAGSVVDRDVPPYCIYAGNRARFVRLAPGRRDWRPEDVEAARRAGLPAEVIAQINAELAGK